MMPAMETLALLLILFSALMHALWNLMVKKSRDKTIFIWWMFLCSWLLMNLLVLAFDLFPVLSRPLVLLAASAACCFVLYHWLGGFAYRQGDLSVTYPLAQTAMFYVPIWGVLFLGEKLSGVGVAGIILIALGAYCIQLRGLGLRDFIRPFGQIANPSVQAALLAGLVYSIGVIIDKAGVDGYSPFGFTYVLVFFMLIYMSLNLLRPRYRGRILRGRQENPHLLIWAGPVIMASFLSFRYGLQLAPVSYAVPVRQVSLLIGVLIGLVFLGESFGRIRLTSASLILAGVFCVWHG
ncbi:MAG: EamA family transporter [Pelovirga sp.]